MKLRGLIKDNNAVSPVIGVILMIAITVILAAIIGAFALNNNNLVNTSPKIQWEYTAIDGDDDGDIETVKARHSTGSDVEYFRVSASASGGDLDKTDESTTDTMYSGDWIEFQGPSTRALNKEDIRIIWSEGDGKKTATIGKYTVT